VKRVIALVPRSTRMQVLASSRTLCRLSSAKGDP
jgi:hypothetical protein